MSLGSGFHPQVREYVREASADGSGGSAAGAGWPLCANILDPIRASVVCSGPAQILQVRCHAIAFKFSSLPACLEVSSFLVSFYPPSFRLKLT